MCQDDAPARDLMEVKAPCDGPCRNAPQALKGSYFVMPLNFVKSIVSAAAVLLPLTVGAGEVHAAAEYPYLVRLRGLVVEPDEGATITPIGGGVDITRSFVPELDLSYFLTDNWALELILAVTPHKATARNTAVADVTLGKTVLLPPTLTLQYHFLTHEKIRPYVGAGLNYTFFFDTKDQGVSDLHFKNNLGYALQAGVDFAIDDHWMVNFDVKKLFLSTKATMWAGAARIQANVDIDPWIIGLGVGYRI
jgi:outer membrane protein